MSGTKTVVRLTIVFQQRLVLETKWENKVACFASHPIDPLQRNLGIEYAHPFSVGNHIWFGAGVHVLGGVTIGDNVVVGAGFVVKDNIPSNSLAVRNPCTVVKELPPIL